jgi:hypothetical protein
MKHLTCLLCFTLIAPVAWCQQKGRPQNNNSSDDLQIVVIQGEDGANIVQDGTFADTIVEVRDRNNLPIVGGAVVTAGVVWAIAAHTGGTTPGAFANGSNTVTITADAQGRAVIEGFHPSGTGQVNIQVQANFQGHTGHATVHQTNFPTTAAAQAAGKTPGNQQQGSQQSSSPQQSSPANTTTNASQVVSHGMSTGMKTLLVVGGVGAAGGGAAYAAGAFKPKTSDSGGGSCSNLSSLQSQVNTFISTINNCANTSSTKSSSCQSAYTQLINIYQSLCTCVGSPVPSTFLQAYQQMQSLAPEFGVATPANGSCH